MSLTTVTREAQGELSLLEVQLDDVARRRVCDTFRQHLFSNSPTYGTVKGFDGIYREKNGEQCCAFILKVDQVGPLKGHV